MVIEKKVFDIGRVIYCVVFGKGGDYVVILINFLVLNGVVSINVVRVWIEEVCVNGFMLFKVDEVD